MRGWKSIPGKWKLTFHQRRQSGYFGFQWSVTFGIWRNFKGLRKLLLGVTGIVIINISPLDGNKVLSSGERLFHLAEQT